jgi:hypothetical protein
LELKLQLSYSTNSEVVGTLTFTKKINTSTIGLPASNGISGSLFGIKDERFILCHFQACAYCSE